MRQKLIVVMAGVSMAFASTALGQPVTQTDVSGNECWNAGQGPGGPSTGFLCISQVRNGRGLRTFSGSGTVVATTQAQSDGTLFWTGAAPTCWNVTLVSLPFDGELLTLSTDTSLSAIVNVTAGSGTTLNTSFTTGTIAPNNSIVFQYRRAVTTWFRLQ